MGMDLSRHKGSAYDMSGEADMKHFEDLSQRRASSIGDSSSRRGSRRSNRGSPEQTKKKEIAATVNRCYALSIIFQRDAIIHVTCQDSRN